MRISFSLMAVLFPGLFLLFPGTGLYGQCVVDTQYTSPGFYPSDSLPDMQLLTPLYHTMQVVFPEDTVFQGYTLVYDSLKIMGIDGLPPGIQWECDQDFSGCTYLASPGTPTRGCVSFWGSPTAVNQHFPDYDTSIIRVRAWLTIPMVGGGQALDLEYPLYHQVQYIVHADEPEEPQAVLQVTQEAGGLHQWISYELATATETELSLYDLQGRQILALHRGYQEAGRHRIPVPEEALAGGIYLVRLDVDGSGRSQVVRLVRGL